MSGIEILLIRAFLLTLALWLAISAYVLLSRLRHEWRSRQSLDLERALTAAADLPPVDRAHAIHRALSRLSRRRLDRIIIDATRPAWITEILATHMLERWGVRRLVRDAGHHRAGRKWRRIAALFVVGHSGRDEGWTLLAQAVSDADADVASAAVLIASRLEDRHAVEILIAALRQGSVNPSRVATHLDELPMAIDDLIRPLLRDPIPHVRYWGASLLARYPDAARDDGDLAALEGDADPGVRKMAIKTMGMVGHPLAQSIALSHLEDPADFVRSQSIRSLAEMTTVEPRAEGRRFVTGRIAAGLADQNWYVRLAAKESLVMLGPAVWREVTEQLDSTDAFARNGAAEVLQNLGLIDALIEEIAGGGEVSVTMVDVLERAFREGGTALIDAAVARSHPEHQSQIEALLVRLGFAKVS